MEQICLGLPLQQGQSDEPRDFMREFEASRKPTTPDRRSASESRKRFGSWPRLPGVDMLVGYMETGDFANALALFSQSQDEFDMGFKRRMAGCTGVDLNDPPTMALPELLSSYSDHAALA